MNDFSHFLVLNSSNQKDLYPLNHAYHFINQMPFHIHLQRRSKIGLVQIDYSTEFLNIAEYQKIERFYLCLDIVEENIVGGSKKINFIKIIPILPKDTKAPQRFCLNYNVPEFYPLSRNSFDRIEVKILTPEGKIIKPSDTVKFSSTTSILINFRN